MAQSDAQPDAFRQSTADLMRAISRDHELQADEKNRTLSPNRTTKPVKPIETETAPANKIFGVVMALFIGAAMAVLLFQA